jgi:hypothetical protein
MKTVEVIRPGSEVMIGTDAGIRGHVNEVTIGYGLIAKYSVSWWDNRTLLTGDFREKELKAAPEDKVVIGFVSPSTPDDPAGNEVKHEDLPIPF